MAVEWFRHRAYRHFDVPVNRRYAARVMAEGFASGHSFSPMLRFMKAEKRYRPGPKPKAGAPKRSYKVEIKERPIMFAAHRDACIYSYFSAVGAERLEAWYLDHGLSENAIAYRRLGRANYHFAAEVAEFARRTAPSTVLAFDVTKFFEKLDHKLLKARLKAVLGVKELSEDWYAVLRSITRFSYVERGELEANPALKPIFEGERRHPLVTVREMKDAAVVMRQNPDHFGIPQGSPISSLLANIYMIEFDRRLAAWANPRGALYRRYSDDILIVCRPDDANAAEAEVISAIAAEKLAINPKKTERTLIEPGGLAPAQYLGFSFRHDGTSIRPSSMSRQWRKLKRAAHRIEKAGRLAMANGKADKIFTRSLRKRFSAVQVRNFSSYAMRSSDVLSSRAIRRQALLIEREADRIIRGFL